MNHWYTHTQKNVPKIIARSRDASTSNVCANLYTANVLVILMSPKLANDLYYIIILKWSNYS